MQLWAIGREANPDILAEIDPTFPYVSASGVPVEGHSKAPRPLTSEEIKEYVRLHAQAANAAINEAGFDGVELDFAGGYLIDEFLKEFSNQRTDEYGGSSENRARFALEVIDAVASEIGADRVGMKLTPWDTTRGKGYGEHMFYDASYLTILIRDRKRGSRTDVHVSGQGGAPPPPQLRVPAR